MKMEVEEICSTSNEDSKNERENVENQKGEQEKTIKVHPLAIINISDHHTRAKCGGSPLPASTAVMGLLFGFQEDLVIDIVDSIEVECLACSEEEEQKHHKELIQTKIELHQKVFSSHEVVGWYRISEDKSNPSDDDLKLTHFSMRDYNETPLFLFVSSASTQHPHSDDEHLPMSIYETIVTLSDHNQTQHHDPQLKPVFRTLEFQLDTCEPERIAAEKVFHSNPSIQPLPTSSSNNNQTPPQTPSAHDIHLNSLSSSITALNTRITTLLTYLHSIQNNTVQPDYKILRMIDTILHNLPPPQMLEFQPQFQHDYQDMLLISYLAVLANTLKSLHSYTDKFQVIQDSTKRDVKSRIKPRPPLK